MISSEAPNEQTCSSFYFGQLVRQRSRELLESNMGEIAKSNNCFYFGTDQNGCPCTLQTCVKKKGCGRGDSTML